jgi:hypothetical protein
MAMKQLSKASVEPRIRISGRREFRGFLFKAACSAMGKVKRPCMMGTGAAISPRAAGGW